MTTPSFRISTKIQLHTFTKHQWQNTDQTPASKSCLNFNFKILTKHCAENKSLTLRLNLSFQIRNKLLPTWSSSSTSATVTTSTSFELTSSHTWVTSIKSTKRESVSQAVSDKPMIGLRSDKIFKDKDQESKGISKNNKKNCLRQIKRQENMAYELTYRNCQSSNKNTNTKTRKS